MDVLEAIIFQDSKMLGLDHISKTWIILDFLSLLQACFWHKRVTWIRDA